MNARHVILAVIGGAALVAPGDYLSSAEQQHLDAVRSLLDAYGEDDPTDGLESGSENHLRAFVMNLSRTGVDYEAQVLSDSEVSSIAGR